MIWTMGLTKDNDFIQDFSIEEISALNLRWYWVDFDQPDADEAALLRTVFDFHPLALRGLSRPSSASEAGSL